MKRTIVILGLFFLSGCIGEQKSTQNSARTAVDGRIFLEEQGGAVQRLAQVRGGFTLKGREGVAIARDRRSALVMRGAIPGAGTSCQTYKIPKSYAAAEKLQVTVGEFKLQLRDTEGKITSELYLDEDSQHAYKRTFDFEIPAAVHTVQARGSKQTYPFQLPISMPLGLVSASANSFAFNGGQAAVVSKAAGVNLEWDAPSTTKDSIMALDLETSNATEITLVLCDILEKDLTPSGGKYQWSIPANHLAALHTGEGSIVLHRMHGFRLVDEKIGEFVVVGDRIAVNLAQVND